jgi:uncharacterized protein YcbK (DUF882 family)
VLTLKELNPKTFPTTPEIDKNLAILLDRLNQVRSAFGKPMICTSGLRSIKDHKRIYEKKGIPENKIPMKSKHLFGQAADIFDPNQELQEWCKKNEDLLKTIGLWMESFSATPNWCHFQIVPYGSYQEGKSIWFNP